MANRNGRVILMSNPSSDFPGAALAAARAVARLHELGLEVEHIAGVDRRHAEELAHAAVASRPEAFVVVGGDGAVSIAAQALAGSDIPLGIIPGGSGNDTARDLGLPLDDVVRAADIAAAGRVRRIDLGHIRLADGTERHFIGVAGADYSAEVITRARRLSSRLPGAVRFALAVMSCAPDLRLRHYTLVTDDGRDLSGRYYLASIGNMPSFGAGLEICPAADDADGLLDLTLFRPTTVPRLRLAGYLRQSRAGGVVPDQVVRFERARALELHCPGRDLYADGDRVGPTPATISTDVGALSVLVP